MEDHAKLYLTDPERAHMWDSTPVKVPGPLPTLLLTTTGRKSGEERHACVVYMKTGNGYLIVGSKGGARVHPAWYLNLEHNPTCEIRVSSYRSKARARILAGEERQHLWKQISAKFPFYDTYQARTERPIPLIMLEPVSA